MIELGRSCPHCNSPRGVLIKNEVYGVIAWSEDFNGKPTDDGLESLTMNPRKYVYCVNCGKRLVTLEEWERYKKELKR